MSKQKLAFMFYLLLISILSSACNNPSVVSNGSSVTATQVLATSELAHPANTPKAIYTTTPTVDPDFIPKFVNNDFVDLGNIQQISLFRSGEGHDYWDNFEKCRSMKHYYKPTDNLDWSTISIYSPVDGIVTAYQEEWAGIQIHIQSTQYPKYRFIIFHVNVDSDINVGYSVTEGMKIGTHVGNMTNLDIAVGRNNSGAYKLVSYFDVMTDELFQKYQARGVQERTDLIISREERDADPLTCDSETFTSQGSHPNWFILQ